MYGKTDRLYIKRYEEETNLRAHIILDASKSMLYSSAEVSKLIYANSLAASLSYLMINQQDAVGIAKFSDKIDTFIPPKARPSHLNLILSQLDDKYSGYDTQIGIVLHELADRIKKRGIVILISDLLDKPENIMKGLKHFRHQNQEVIVFHILDRKESEFDFDTRTKFLDMETGEEIVTEPWHIRSNYNELISLINEKSENKFKVIIAPGPSEIKEASNINALCVLDNGKALDISQLATLIKDSSFVVANDTGPAHMTAHLGSKGIALFGSHTTPFKVSIERENFKAIQAPELSKLSAEKVFERLSEIIF